MITRVSQFGAVNAYLVREDDGLTLVDTGMKGGVATTAKPYLRFPLPGFVTWHGPTALESARTLRALEPARLAPGHGRIVDDPVAAMDAAIARGAK